MTTVLAIDQGTSGTKAVVVDPLGVLAVAEVPVSVRHASGGAVEVDPRDLLASVLTAGRAAVQQAARDVDVVGLANQGETVLAWDRDSGEPLSPAIVWQDRRSQGIVDELAASHELLAARTGLVADPYFSAPKMAWLRREITRAGVVTTSDSWLVNQLSGEFVTDVATASRSLLTSLDGSGWDDELLGLFALDGEQLPRIVANDAVVGTTTAFGATAALGGLIVDQQAALLAQGCLAPGDAKCTYGTGAFLLANAGSSAQPATSGLATSVAWELRGRREFCVDGQVYTAASAVAWLQRLGLIASAADIDKVAADDANGAVAVPALAGLAAPRWRPQATATFAGLTATTGAPELVLAAMQGIAAQVAELVEAVGVDLGAPLTALRVDGGLARCATLMQATADLAQVPVHVCPFEHATALGAAATARLSVETSSAVGDVVSAWSPTTAFVPRWTGDRASDFMTRWRSVADSVLDREGGR